jgi:CheY-like chemotaxis protein/glycine cleavage system H lipoate-binding protein
MWFVITVAIILGMVLFVLLNIAAREMYFRIKEMKRKAEYAEALKESLNLDFTRESKTLKRVEIKEPKARILCVDDEEVILDSFRKILALDGYAVDTVETGQEALGLVQMHDYDFVFNDLKMPTMSSVDVTKSVKHMRPDIDVIIITGYASVDTAVECMRHGAMDYVEKPFTEEELQRFARQALIKRQDRLQRQLKAKVRVTGPGESGNADTAEFTVPGGVLLSSGHCWANLREEGTARVGVDDFASKLIGRFDSVEFPNVGMKVRAGQELFAINQGHRRAHFNAPLSGTVVGINESLRNEAGRMGQTPYGEQWICLIEGSNLDDEMAEMKIGKSAVAWLQDEIDRFKAFASADGGDQVNESELLSIGAIARMDDTKWDAAMKAFFGH